MNRQLREYRRTVHVIPRGVRPQPIRRIQRHLERQHARPQLGQHDEVDFTVEEFFKRNRPFSRNDIIRFAELEDSWPIHCLPEHVTDAGSLRLFVWNQERPTPPEHYEQCVIRLPLLETLPGAREFFTMYARAQLENYEGERTNRCPLCGSHLLGYALYDHPVEYCPFANLSDEQKIRFVAINSISYCTDCNARSATHLVKECKPKGCRKCDGESHTSALAICNHPLGKDTDEAHTGLQEFVDRCRYESLARLQEMLQTKDHGLMYRSHIDSPYTYIRERRLQDANTEYKGWGVLIDHRNDFQFTQIQCYGNYHKGKQADYRSMVPPEYHSQVQSKIPRFQPAAMEYLQTIGNIVTEYRQNSDSLNNVILLPLPREQPAPIEAAQRAEMNNAQQDPPAAQGVGNRPHPLKPPPVLIPPAVMMKSLQHRQHPLNSSTAPQNQSPLDRAIAQLQKSPEGPSTSSQSASNSNTLSNIKPTQAQKELQMRMEMDRARQEGFAIYKPTASQPTTSDSFQSIQSQSSTSASTQASSQDTPVQDKTAEKESPESTTSTPKSTRSSTTPIAEISSSADINVDEEVMKIQEQQELELEKKLAESARLWCREPLRIINGQELKAARPSFQSKAFQIIKNEELPDGSPAAVERCQTLLYVLTGQEDSRTEVYNTRSNSEIREYARRLLAVGEILKNEKVLVVTIEAEALTKVCKKTSSGTAAISIPSIDLYFKHPTLVKKSLDRLGQDNGHGTRFIDYFPTNRDGRLFFVDQCYKLHTITEKEQTPFESRLEQECDLPWPKNWEFNCALLKKEFDQPLPTCDGLIGIRVCRLMQHLAGTSGVDEYRQCSVQEAINYGVMIKAAYKAIWHIRSNGQTVVAVSRISCFEELATAASRGHELVMPTIELFKKHGWNHWQNWLELAWRQLVSQMLEKEQVCRCPQQHLQ